MNQKKQTKNKKAKEKLPYPGMTKKSKNYALMSLLIIVTVIYVYFKTLDPLNARNRKQPILKNVSRRIIRKSNQLFPKDFMFGVATSAFQTEGACSGNGKGQSIWDDLIHTRPEMVNNKSNANITANSYHLFKRDIEMLKELGVDSYTFSISWSRIMPDGIGAVNQLGIDHYNSVINELIAHKITPFVTMYHWDLPQKLEEKGGWLNERIVDWFANYSTILYDNFGDRVKHWITINDPYTQCYKGYGYATHAPLQKSPGFFYYQCVRIMLLSNAIAHRFYKSEYYDKQRGVVGFALKTGWAFADDKTEIESSPIIDYQAFQVDHFIHPIFSEESNYPEEMEYQVKEKSRAQGLIASRLRPLNNRENEFIQGTADFIGLNILNLDSSKYVYRNKSLEGSFEVPSVDDDAYIGTCEYGAGDPDKYAVGLYYLLIYLKENYNNPAIYITQNGMSTSTGLNDDERIKYIKTHLRSIDDARSEGANVKGYFVYSLMDSFEWTDGYSTRFGLYEVDMNDPNRTRTPRKSAKAYQEIIRNLKKNAD